jgi:hypothetical protein
MRANMPSARRPEVFASGGVALLAVLVRLPNVYSQPFWQDEVALARILREPNIAARIGESGDSSSSGVETIGALGMWRS